MSDQPDIDDTIPRGEIPVSLDSLRKMLDLLTAMIREGGRQDRVELVELSERCKALVEDALRRGTN